MTPTVHDVDYLVIGSGVAGLTYALATSARGRTLILTKKSRAESNSNYAQGGIAGVMAEDDDVTLHVDDTLTAGAGLCHLDAVQTLVSEGADRIRDLIALGAHFTLEPEPDAHGVRRLALGREGGHSRNRIVHAADRTGWECERTLLEAAKGRADLEILEHYFVLDLALTEPDEEGSPRCIGAYAVDPDSGELVLFRARATLLATGGCGQVYRHTTNPEIATGDGVAMAWRAGAEVANMEFIQFHPTALYHPEGRSFLISEAVRGEGGLLRTASGERFMDRYHPKAELAPRDVVARAIHAERLRRGEPCVYLDVTALDADFLRKRFPTIHDRLLSLGIDITHEPIPVVPAAHYQCGGVRTDLDGRTSIPGLFAAGEVACTGVHGANRLASNSLLEAMVFGHRAAAAAIDAGRQDGLQALAPTSLGAEEVHDRAGLRGARERLQAVMNDRVGIVRNDRSLDAAREAASAALAEADGFCRQHRPDPELWELRNLAQVASLIVGSALIRKESRGLHYTTDYPDTDDLHWKHDTLLAARA